jgi:hypothetical protein
MGGEVSRQTSFQKQSSEFIFQVNFPPDKCPKKRLQKTSFGKQKGGYGMKSNTNRNRPTVSRKSKRTAYQNRSRQGRNGNWVYTFLRQRVAAFPQINQRPALKILKT